MLKVHLWKQSTEAPRGSRSTTGRATPTFGLRRWTQAGDGASGGLGSRVRIKGQGKFRSLLGRLATTFVFKSDRNPGSGSDDDSLRICI
jgi:hypothetical protein